MKVVTVSGKQYEIDGIPYGTMPSWRLVKHDGQPITHELFNDLPDADKRALHERVQQYIRETAAYQAEVAARSAALASAHP